MGGFRGGDEGAEAPPFFLYFQNLFVRPNPSNRFSSDFIVIQSG